LRWVDLPVLVRSSLVVATVMNVPVRLRRWISPMMVES
jgi:hypothetical protein